MLTQACGGRQARRKLPPKTNAVLEKGSSAKALQTPTGSCVTKTKARRLRDDDRRKALKAARSRDKFRKMNHRIKDGRFVEAVGDFLESLGTPRALTVWMLLREGGVSEHRQLVELTCDPRHYFGPGATNRFAFDWQATKLLSKCATLNTGIDRKAVAIQAAEQAELRCRETNRRIQLYQHGCREAAPVDEDVLSYMQAKIAEVLMSSEIGLYVKTALDGDVDVGWSSGRTTSAFGSEVSPVHKYSSRLDVTTGALRWARALLSDCHMWSASVLQADGPCSLLKQAFTITSGNVMTVVPKNAKTDRVICYEPHLNIRMQLAVGKAIRGGLRRHGVNLNDQSVNQRRAIFGSKYGSLATLDLKAASDTVALRIVELLLPPNWYNVLCDLRSGYTLWPDGVVRKNEKFSSMGNGFTFELESLIFWAAAMAVCKTGVSVFGDDLIVPSAKAREVIAVLNGLGFEVNDQKSFIEGPFRESCGYDGFLGYHVTPVKIDNLTKVADYVLFHNQVRTWASSHLPTKSVATMLKQWRSEFDVPLGPSGCGDKPYGDGHFHANFEEACPPKAGHGLDGWWFWTTARAVEKDRHSDSISRKFAWAALCAAVGPKRVRTLYDSLRATGRWKPLRALASYCWPDVLWV